ncbi:MAG: BMC domain-containing protein [Synergistaceae bacterium]|jgi:microcompartment protein CcmL/EutN|nr:BMC domain-containing protein [Synergistaceae bacterium]
MITSIGLIEFNSIARGIESADVMLKAGTVGLVFSKPVCPGKYLTLVSGDVGAVKVSIAAGLEKGGGNVVNSLIIPRVHPNVIPAINAATEIDGTDAVGVVEYFDIASAIVGADAASKAANVKLIELRLGMGIGGKSYFSMCGQVSDVKSAAQAAMADSEERGAIVNSCVIPSPSPELFNEML